MNIALKILLIFMIFIFLTLIAIFLFAFFGCTEYETQLCSNGKRLYECKIFGKTMRRIWKPDSSCNNCTMQDQGCDSLNQCKDYPCAEEKNCHLYSDNCGNIKCVSDENCKGKCKVKWNNVGCDPLNFKMEQRNRCCVDGDDKKGCVKYIDDYSCKQKYSWTIGGNGTLESVLASNISKKKMYARKFNQSKSTSPFAVVPVIGGDYGTPVWSLIESGTENAYWLFYQLYDRNNYVEVEGFLSTKGTYGEPVFVDISKDYNLENIATWFYNEIEGTIVDSPFNPTVKLTARIYYEDKNVIKNRYDITVKPFDGAIADADRFIWKKARTPDPPSSKYFKYKYIVRYNKEPKTLEESKQFCFAKKGQIPSTYDIRKSSALHDFHNCSYSWTEDTNGKDILVLYNKKASKDCGSVGFNYNPCQNSSCKSQTVLCLQKDLPKEKNTIVFKL